MLDEVARVWTAGMVAIPLIAEVPGMCDALGRLAVDQHLGFTAAPQYPPRVMSPPPTRPPDTYPADLPAGQRAASFFGAELDRQHRR
jgi:hypothetical protein